MKPVIVAPEADAEFEAAVDYFEDVREGLGEEFRVEVQATLTRIRQDPGLFAVFTRDLRRCLVDRFPYVVIYRECDTFIRVLAIAHHRRRPGYWLRRDPN